MIGRNSGVDGSRRRTGESRDDVRVAGLRSCRCEHCPQACMSVAGTVRGSFLVPRGAEDVTPACAGRRDE